MGPEHVGLGTDLVYDAEGFTCFFEGNKGKYCTDYEKPLTAFLQSEQLPEVTEGLLERGLRREQESAAVSWAGYYLRVVQRGVALNEHQPRLC